MKRMCLVYLSGEILVAGVIAKDSWYIFIGLCSLIIWRAVDQVVNQIEAKPIQDDGPPACPDCGSRNYSVKPAGLQNSLQSSLPLWFLSTYKLRFNHTCKECGCEWIEVIVRRY